MVKSTGRTRTFLDKHKLLSVQILPSEARKQLVQYNTIQFSTDPYLFDTKKRIINKIYKDIKAC